jgi:SAM-dependent methyltransferase
MAERNAGLRAALSRPLVYVLLQRLVGAGRSHPRFLNDHVRARPGDRVLDLGCGPGELVELLPAVDYVGIDRDDAYIEAARRRHPKGGMFICSDVVDAEIGPQTFDVALVMGLVHHLDDDAATALFRVAADALRPDGRLVVIEPAFVKGQSRVARWLVRRDRGDNVRTPDQYRRLATTAFRSVSQSVHHDFLRVPYTHTILECGIPKPTSR